MELHRHHAGLQLHKPITQHRIVHQALAARRFFLHQFDDGLQARVGGVGIAQHAAFIFQCGVGDEPALPAPAHHVLLWHAHIGEKHFVEFGIARHRFQWANVDARGRHREQDVAYALVLGALAFGAHETEDHVRALGGGGPDFLAVDEKIAAVFNPARLQRGKIGACAGLRIALTPDDFTAQGGRDVLALLFFAADFQQRRNQHRNALPGNSGWRFGTGEFFGNDTRLKNIGGRAITAIHTRDGARGITILDQQLLPGQHIGRGPPAAIRLWKLSAMVFEKRTRLAAKVFVFGAVCEIHVSPLSSGTCTSVLRRASARVSTLYAVWEIKSSIQERGD